jgi:tRNA(Met) cytidine acetyltransferase
MTWAQNGWSPHMLDFKHYKVELDTIQHTLSVSRHRQLLLITGEHDFCLQAAVELFTHSQSLILSQSEHVPNAHWPEHLHQVLGQEWNHVIYDGFSGLLPNMLSAVSGTVKAGGLLILLLPELDELPHFIDPAAERWCSAGYDITHSFFLERFTRLLAQEPCMHLSQQNGFHYRGSAKNKTLQSASLDEQTQVVTKMASAIQSKKALPIVLCADRGRGKSSALGLLAKSLPNKQFILCSANRQSVSNVFKHLGVPEPQIANCNTFENVTFLPIDRVLAERPKCDVLLVDEAAAIPVSLLLEFLKHYPHSIFASTLIGYEGNGRGYTLKFLKKLQTGYPNHQTLELSMPIRFAKADPLEATIKRLFALDCQYDSQPLATADLCFAELTAAELCRDERLLQQVFALLVLAHYQTSVNDLRQLLDTPNQRLYVLKNADHIAAVCLVSMEGGFSPELCAQVILGTRRPRGHLLAQQLTAIQDDPVWCEGLVARIVRIAVDPHYQGQGLGSRMLHLIEVALPPEINAIGSSFGANAELLNYWLANGYHLAKLGFKQDKVSGEHAAMVIKSRTTQYDQLVIALTQQFVDTLPYQLLTYFKHLDTNLVLSLWKDRCKLIKTNLNVVGYAAVKQRSTAELQPLLWQTLNANPTQLQTLTLAQQQIIARYVLQGWQLGGQHYAYATLSKKQLELELNEIANRLFC